MPSDKWLPRHQFEYYAYVTDLEAEKLQQKAKAVILYLHPDHPAYTQVAPFAWVPTEGLWPTID